ncbi:MAG: EAL domain-containing protein [Solirubrobacteraceae bacterium]
MFTGPDTLAPHQGDAEVPPVTAQQIEDALAGGRFSLAYQPILTAAQDTLVGCEVLLRWRDPKHGDIPPNAIIPVAERTGLIFELGDRVLAAACRQLSRWRTDPAWGDAGVWVNISALQLADVRFPARVAAALREAGIDGTGLCLEVTESALVDVRSHNSLAVMAELRAMGVRLALDDFGTGYSSLSYLRHLPIDVLKLDRSFTAQITTDASVAPIVQAVTDMAHALGVSLVAEGVETDEQRAAMTRCGTDTVQGYLFGRPMRADRLTRWHAEWLRRPAPADTGASVDGVHLNIGALPDRPAPTLAQLLETEGDALFADAARRIYAAPAPGRFGTSDFAQARERWLSALRRDSLSGNYCATAQVSDALFRQAAAVGATPLELHLFVTSMRLVVTRALRRDAGARQDVMAAWNLFTALEHRLLSSLRSTDRWMPGGLRPGEDAG